MQLRRGLMMAMAKGGTNTISGVITPETTDTISVAFGRTLTKYLILLEMTDESIANLINSGYTNYKPYLMVGIYGETKVNDLTPVNRVMYFRYNGSVVASALSNILSTASDGFTISVTNQNAATYQLQVGYQYKYLVVPIE